MATLKQRLHRKNASGTYDTIHYETSADMIVGSVAIANGGTGATTAANARTNLGITPGNIGAAASSHIHDDRYYTESEVNSLLSGKAPSFHTHDASQITSGVLPVDRGGTGRSTLTSGYFLRGNGTGAVAMSSIDDVKKALGVSSGGGSYDIGSSGVGTIVKWANKNWIICHTENGLIYLAGLFFVSTSQKFDSGGSTAYAGSDLAQACVTYQNTIPSDSLALAVNTTVNGVTNKIFVASYEQMNGGFMIFYSNSQRELMNRNYWTSSSSSSTSVWNVRHDGSLSVGSSNTVAAIGFRPFVALRL